MPAAAERTRKAQEDQNAGICKQKKHSGDFGKMTWDKRALKKEIENLPDDAIINWSDIARKYEIKNKKGQISKNGGQTAQDFLISKGVNLHRFRKRKSSIDTPDELTRIWRKKLKGPGGEISFPCQETETQAREKLKEKVCSGEYCLGDVIVPRKYEKLVYKDGGAVRKIFFVEGRKIPLQRIRENTLKEHEKYMRLHDDTYYETLSEKEIKYRLKRLHEIHEHLSNDELRNLHANSVNMTLEELRKKLKSIERTRYIQVWMDSSSIANHGHLVAMVNILYDPAIHLSNEEYFAKYGKVVDVQTEIERPDLYLVARCRSNDEQLAYVETRMECIAQLQNDLKSDQGLTIRDRMRLFHGDGPVVEIESGQQKGGHFYCAGCGCHAEYVHKLEHVFRCPLRSIAERQELVLAGPIGKMNSLLKKTKPLSNLTARELDAELLGRGLLEKEFYKADLQAKLTEELKGISRVPALLFQSPEASLENLGLERYEVLPHEPMHDIAGHISNLFEELPYHLDAPREPKRKENVRKSSTKLKGIQASKTTRTKGAKTSVSSVTTKLRDADQPEKSKVLTEATKLAMEGKEVKRCVDYRCGLLKVIHMTQGN